MYASPGSIVSLPMQRRLHKRLEHGLLALMAITACAGLALMAARPLPAAGAAEAAFAPASVRPDTSVTAEAHTPQRKRNAIRRSRQSLAMPYFSFAAGN